MRLDIVNNLKTLRAWAQGDRSGTDTKLQGDTIDMGADGLGLMLTFNVGPETDTLDGSVNAILQMQHSDDGVTFEDVPADDYLQEGPITIDAAALADRVHKLGYRGVKRYVRPQVELVGAHATGLNISATAALKVKEMPVPN